MTGVESRVPKTCPAVIRPLPGAAPKWRSLASLPTSIPRFLPNTLHLSFLCSQLRAIPWAPTPMPVSSAAFMTSQGGPPPRPSGHSGMLCAPLEGLLPLSCHCMLVGRSDEPVCGPLEPRDGASYPVLQPLAWRLSIIQTGSLPRAWRLH